MPFEFKPAPDIPDVILIEPRVFSDPRGWFLESFKRSEFEKAGIPHDFRQDNHSLSLGRGVLRGLHYQKDPFAQGKLVRVLRGAVFDVAVDIRKGSPTYGRWVAFELSEENRRIVWIPPGFAHAFWTLAEATEVAYKTTAEYSPTHDRAIRWNDPAIGIRWPGAAPILSAKDRDAPLLADADNTFVHEGRA